MQRDHIAKTVAANGAEYHGDLTKAVTHPIAAVPQGKKYEFALMWKVKVISLEWLQESIERGMVLDEELYDPRLPTEERGKDAWKREPEEMVTLGKRTRDSEGGTAAADNNRRKLRRTASTKLGSQSQSIWADIASFGLNKSDPVRGAPLALDLDTPRRPGAQSETGATVSRSDRKSDADAKTSLPTAGNATAPAYSIKRGIFAGRLVCIDGFDSKQVGAPYVPALNSVLTESDVDTHNTSQRQ